MKLRTTPPSPFGRKVKITAKIVGCYDDLDIINADTSDPDDSLRQQNPLGKVPTLILEDGRCLYDSRVICEYLNDRADMTLFGTGDDKVDILTVQAIADGLTDAAVLQVYENRFRPEDKRSEDWVAYQAGKVTRTLDYLEDNLPPQGRSVNIGHISLACALGYLDLRFEGSWRQSHPKLLAWLEGFSDRVNAFDETKMKEGE